MGFFDKVSDALNSPQSIFEKDCIEFTCYSLANLSKSTTIQGKYVDEIAGEIQFSGDVIVGTKDIPAPKFFVDDKNRVFTLDDSSIKTKIEEIQQKSKVATYGTTTAKFSFKKLDIVDL